ncbi:DinB family protein [Streptomyces sp. MST-110588]|uniref:DinB family protein n=1 Tax=Streptomyces sp. MST-110588 TaxID=2833628 RepID=UPI001F5C4113|nr:DinB family protein [Streptomyces sp. MST-110588]UNO40216.1 DinB family protein [Streptomyces sp. MST-110588]
MVTMPDGRSVPPPHADERTMLESWLQFHRDTLALKCAGLDDRRIRLASAPPSSMTLLGLVQHMAEVERHWFQRVLAGQDVPPLYPDGLGNGFALAPGRGIDEALSAWRAEVGRSHELIANASLDDSGDLPESQVGYVAERSVSLRWILIHMIEEYARHNGHADLIRERIDGVTGT